MLGGSIYTDGSVIDSRRGTGSAVQSPFFWQKFGQKFVPRYPAVLKIQRFEKNYSMIYYSVMQSDVNSWKIDTFQEAITSELMNSSAS